uniref:Uncharacterized protein n=1 Tax=Crocodylus porosus TaxID=8502 RepID=A0A7M4G1G8_CROPO
KAVLRTSHLVLSTEAFLIFFSLKNQSWEAPQAARDNKGKQGLPHTQQHLVNTRAFFKVWSWGRGSSHERVSSTTF